MKFDLGVFKFVAIGIAIIIVIAVVLRMIHVKTRETVFPEAETESTEEEVSEEVYEDPVEEVAKEIITLIPGNGFEEGAVERYVNSKSCVQIEKIFTEIVEDSEGNRKTTYTKYYAGEVDFSKMTDKTFDYTDCMSEDGYIDENTKDIAFADAFGFSYGGCSSMMEFYDLARKSSGFDGDLKDSTYDDEKYDLMKEESYDFNGDCSILYQMLGDMDYDKLIRSGAYYSLLEDDGVKFPYSFNAIVQYEKDGLTITKTAYMGLCYFNEGERGGCDCGSDNSSCEGDCGDSCCSEGGCNGDEPCPSCGGVGGCTDDCTGACCN